MERLLDLDPAPAHTRRVGCHLLRHRGPDDLHGGHRPVDDPNGVVDFLEAHESPSVQLVYVVLLCPSAGLAKLVLHRRTCREKVGLGACVAH